jgi:hypothetical protein
LSKAGEINDTLSRCVSFMGEPSNPKILKSLEAEARRCEHNQDFLGALDIYEEIEEKGWATTNHLVAMGFCYLKNRQRQNAREIWLRALAQEPENKDTRRMLDRYFPGWEKRTQIPQKRSDQPVEDGSETAPPPPPPGFGNSKAASLSVETQVPETASQETKTTSPRSKRTAQHPKPSRALRPEATGQAGKPKQPAAPAPSVSDAALVHSSVQDIRETLVNWEYVMADVADEAGHLEKE